MPGSVNPMNTIRTATLGLGALLLLGLSAAPSAQAFTIAPVGTDLCPTYDPYAWVNYCVRVTYSPIPVWAYTVDTTPDYTRVCPLPSTCVNVPVVLSLIDPALYTVPYYYTTQNVQPNVGQIYEDACDVIGIACTLAESLLGSTTASSSMPHGLELVGLAEGQAFFELPSGETIVLPLVA